MPARCNSATSFAIANFFKNGNVSTSVGAPFFSEWIKQMSPISSNRSTNPFIDSVSLCRPVTYEVYYVLLGFTGFYWVSLGFIVLLDFIGFFWVLLGFLFADSSNKSISSSNENGFQFGKKRNGCSKKKGKRKRKRFDSVGVSACVRFVFVGKRKQTTNDFWITWPRRNSLRDARDKSGTQACDWLFLSVFFSLSLLSIRFE